MGTKPNVLDRHHGHEEVHREGAEKYDSEGKISRSEAGVNRPVVPREEAKEGRGGGEGGRRRVRSRYRIESFTQMTVQAGGEWKNAH